MERQMKMSSGRQAEKKNVSRRREVIKMSNAAAKSNKVRAEN